MKGSVLILKDAYYFSHDSNARHDIKIQALRSVHGLKGYGMYWVIIELMRDSNDYCLPIKKVTFLALARELDCTADDAKNFIDECINEFGLFISDDLNFWSDSLLSRMDRYNQKKEMQIQKGRKGGLSNKSVIIPQKLTETNLLDVPVNLTAEDKPIKKERIKKENATVAHFEDDVKYLTDLLIKKIKENNANAKVPVNLNGWKKDILAMVDLDKYKFEQIEKIIEFSQCDDFWKSNVLSAKKLREKAGTLILQLQRARPKEKKTESPQDIFDRMTRIIGEGEYR